MERGARPRKIGREDDARRGSTAGSDVQLSFAGAAGTTGSSAARDTRARGCGAGRAVARVCAAVRGERTAIDCAGEVAAGVAAAGALHDPERTAADDSVNLIWPLLIVSFGPT